MQRYMLEVYEPDSTDDLAANFESDTPFLAIQKGDLLTAFGVNGGKNQYVPETAKLVLRVVAVEHIVWVGEAGPRHKVCVFTRGEENTREARFR